MSFVRILVVEPDEILASQIQQMFIKRKFGVKICRTGAEAQAELGINLRLPSNIVLSCELPDADSFELLKQWRRDSRISHLPIILIQQTGTREDVIRGLELGADNVIQKAVSGDDFLHLINRAVIPWLIVVERFDLMGKGEILIVDSDEDNRNMLEVYFRRQGFQVNCAADGESALEIIDQKSLPNLIILAVELPRMKAHKMCRILRTTTRTAHIPVIFLTERDEISSKIRGLELGADDFVAKPFDIEELKLRVQNSMVGTDDSLKIDFLTNLPKGGYIEQHLRNLMRSQIEWAYMDIKIQNFEGFSEVYGWRAGDEVIRATSLMIANTVDEIGTQDDFIGHPGRDSFVVITHSNDEGTLSEKLTQRFAKDILQHYSSIDRERGYMLDGDEQKDLMSLSIGSVSTRKHKFRDIREITELAASDRRRKRDSDIDGDDEDDILTAW